MAVNYPFHPAGADPGTPEKKWPAARATGPEKLSLLELDAIRARAYMARIDLKADAPAPGEGVEVHARVEPGALEEVLATVLGRYEPETRSDTSFLMVPSVSETPLLESPSTKARPLREEGRPRCRSPASGDGFTLPRAPRTS